MKLADTIKSSSELKITWEFADGDTRVTTVKNPRSDLTLADLRAFESATVSSQVIIGDKTGAAVTKIKSAATTDKTDYIPDLS